MAKQKSPSKLVKSKRYDFETPLDPFEGESLKGIAAFIESSLTLQSPAPGLGAGDAEERTSMPSPQTPSITQEAHDIVSSTLDSNLCTDTSSHLLQAEPANLSYKEHHDGESSALNTPLSRTHDTSVLSVIDTSLSRSPNTGVTSIPITSRDVCRTDPDRQTEQRLRIESFKSVTSRHNTAVSSAHNIVITAVPITSVTGTLDITASDELNGISVPTEDSPLSLPNLQGTDDQLLDPTVLDTDEGASRSDHAQPVVRTRDQGVPNTAHGVAKTQSGTLPSLRTSPGAPPPSGVTRAGRSTPFAESSVPDMGRSVPLLEQPVLHDVTSGSVLDTSSSTPWSPRSDRAQLGDQGSFPLSERIIFVRTQPATRGQDGLTKGEEKIYTFLWRTVFGSKEQGKTEFKVGGDTIEVSLRRLAQKVGLGLANCAWHIPCLEEKGCIERVRRSDHFRPAVYRIREFAEIIQWRKEHRLTHFIQRGHLAAFVDPRTGVPITRFRGQTGTVYRGKAITSILDMASRSVSNTSESSIHSSDNLSTNSSTPSVPDSSTPSVLNLRTEVIRETSLNEENTQLTSSTSLSIPPDLIAGLRTLSPGIDQQAVFFLWSECQSRVPDCTPAEVLHFANLKAAILRTGRIQNPVGFLIAAVPKCFEGETFQHFRQQQAKLKEEQRRREDEERREQQAIEDELEQYRREEEARHQAEQLLPTLSEEERTGLYEQARAELSAKGYKAVGPTLEKFVRDRVIRGLAKRILSED